MKIALSRKQFLAIAVALHLLFYFKQVFVSDNRTKDSDEYLYAAENLLNHGVTFAGPWPGQGAYNDLKLYHYYDMRLVSKRPPAYPAFIIAVLFQPWLLYLVQCILSLICILMIEKLLLKFRYRVNYAWLLLLLIFTPSQLIYSNLMMAEIPLQFCITAGVYIWFCEFRQRTLWCSLLLTLAVLLKPVCLFLAPVWLLLILLRGIRQKQYTGILPAALPMLAILVVSLVNKNLTGVSHYSSQAYINKFHYNAYTVVAHNSGNAGADSLYDRVIREGGSTFSSQYRRFNQFSDSVIKSHPVYYGYRHIAGMAACLLDPGRFDLALFFGLPNDIGFYRMLESSPGKDKSGTGNPVTFWLLPVILLILLFNIVRAGLLLKQLIRHFRNPLVLTCFLLAGYFILLTGPVGSSRFLVPMMPLLWLILAWGKSPEMKKA